MKAKRSGLFGFSLVLAVMGGLIISCTAEFKAECPEGTTRSGGGDVDEACISNAGAGGVAGATGSGGSAGTETAGQGQGGAPAAGSGGSTPAGGSGGGAGQGGGGAAGGEEGGASGNGGSGPSLGKEGEACSPTATSCDKGLFCQSSDCATEGVCAPALEVPSKSYDPACGCDGLIYWSKEHASKKGITALDNRTGINPNLGCDSFNVPSAVTCNENGNGCSNDQTCVRTFHDRECSSFASGRCWWIPQNEEETVCSPCLVLNNYATACGTDDCNCLCQIVQKDAKFWFNQNVCPTGL